MSHHYLEAPVLPLIGCFVTFTAVFARTTFSVAFTYCTLAKFCSSYKAQ